MKEKREGFWILPCPPKARDPHRGDTSGASDAPGPVVPAPPELARRVAAFRQQLAEWTASGRVGAPTFGLSGVTVALGQCVGCGESLAVGRAWRCAVCLRAVEVALGLRPVGETTCE